MTLPTTLAGWLSHLESLHLSSIDLGLERVRQVVDAMPLRPGFPVITVGGTNGKGSVCAMLTRCVWGRFLLLSWRTRCVMPQRAGRCLLQYRAISSSAGQFFATKGLAYLRNFCR